MITDLKIFNLNNKRYISRFCHSINAYNQEELHKKIEFYKWHYQLNDAIVENNMFHFVEEIPDVQYSDVETKEKGNEDRNKLAASENKGNLECSQDNTSIHSDEILSNQ
jgi:hypothetical protein